MSIFGADGTVAEDGTDELEFVLFDRVAAGALGKPLMTVLRQRYRGCTTVDEIARAARHDEFIPPEITRLVGNKYKLLVSISKKWKTQQNTEKTLLPSKQGRRNLQACAATFFLRRCFGI